MGEKVGPEITRIARVGSIIDGVIQPVYLLVHESIRDAVGIELGGKIPYGFGEDDVGDDSSRTG